jgi:hypothetical protein
LSEISVNESIIITSYGLVSFSRTPGFLSSLICSALVICNTSGSLVDTFFVQPLGCPLRIEANQPSADMNNVLKSSIAVHQNDVFQHHESPKINALIFWSLFVNVLISNMFL